MKQKIFLFLILTFLTTSVVADEIVLVADEWCPYNCDPVSDKPGFMVEIATIAFAKQGHTIKYITLPWARAIISVRAGWYDGIIGSGKHETPDFIFPDTALGKATHTFYVKKENPWRYEGLDSLKAINLGVITKYSYGNLLEDYIKPNKGNRKVQIVTGNNALNKNIKKLLLGRIDALIEDKSVFNYHLHSTQAPDEFTDAGAAYSEKVYIAFSPKIANSKNYAEILSNTIEELRTNGELAIILKKYGMEDWR